MSKSGFGISLKKVFGEQLLAWPNPGITHLEFVPENWNPKDPTDVRTLKAFAKRFELLPHSLSLNLLGDESPEPILERVLAWAEILDLPWVSDHFCWTGMNGVMSGVFIPPVDTEAEVSAALEANLKKLRLPVHIENIACGFSSKDAARDYHQLLLRCAKRFGLSLVLDLENIRIDAANSGDDPVQILDIYHSSDVPVIYYHAAGGAVVDDTCTDSHDQPCSDLTMELWKKTSEFLPAPVIYERDFYLELPAILSECERLRTSSRL